MASPSSKLLWQNEERPENTCPSHVAFERMIERALDGIEQQIEKLTVAMAAQSKQNAEAIAKILENQSDRREVCGTQSAKIEAIDKRVTAERAETLEARKEIWAAINRQRAIVYVGMGILAALQFVATLISKHMG